MHKLTALSSESSLAGRVLRVCVVAVIPLASFDAGAQITEEDLRLPISMDAESSIYDGKSSMLVFKGLHLTQGDISVTADEGRATKLDFADGVWQFSGNVEIDTGNGHVTCDTANLSFADHQLANATISGSPATFEVRRPDDEETTYAEAGRLNYDFKRAIVEFSENATITEGGNQISSHYLVYNIAEQRINAESAGTDGDRVKITFTPRITESPTSSNNALHEDLDAPQAVVSPDNATLEDLSQQSETESQNSPNNEIPQDLSPQNQPEAEVLPNDAAGKDLGPQIDTNPQSEDTDPQVPAP